MAHERMFIITVEGQPDITEHKINALYITGVFFYQSGTVWRVTVEIGAVTYSQQYGTDESAAQEAYATWLQRAEDAR